MSSGKGITLSLIGFFLLAVMDAIIKGMSSKYGTLELVLFRSLFGLIPVVFLILIKRQLTLFLTKRPKLHFFRSVFATITTFAFFLSLQYLPLADAVSLVFCAPLFLTALAGLVLKEAIGLHRWSAVLFGFLGVVAIMQPGLASFSMYSLLPIVAGLCFAFTVLLGRQLVFSDDSLTIVFYTTLGGIFFSTIFMVVNGVIPKFGALHELILIGLLGGVGQIFIVHAFKYAEVSVLAPFEYSSILWAILFGFWFWFETPNLLAALGFSLISGSGIYISYREVAKKNI